MNLRSIAYVLSLILAFTIPWKDLVDSQFGTIGKMLGFVLAGVWGLSAISTGRIRKWTFFHLAAILFFLWSLVSLFWTIDSGETIYRSIRYVQMFILTVIIWDLYTESSQIRAALQALLLGTWVPILSTIENYRSGVEAVYGRFAATGQVANFTAVLSALGIPIAWYLIVHGKKDSLFSRVLLISNIIFLPASIFAISLTATRFALIMAVPAFAYGFFTLLSTGRRTAWGLAAAIAFATPVTIFALAPESCLNRLSTIGEEVTSGDLTGRKQIWEGGMNIWYEHPMLGVGAGSFPTSIASHFGRPVAAHNSFISVSTELGLVGLTLFSLVILVGAFHAWFQSKPDSQFWLTLGFIWLLANLALSWEETQQTWLLFTLLAAAAANYRLQAREIYDVGVAV